MELYIFNISEAYRMLCVAIGLISREELSHRVLTDAQLTTVFDAIAKLEPTEARILDDRYGLINGACLSLEECARKHNMTRERVQQIETEAMLKLRDPSWASELHQALRSKA